ncbi:MAG: hypothetical protein COB67_08255 [SAR324 cluster bacterium]|uniref:Uncharacterized protein n=1 Tax=SAR324 cluster bacterium TaxID=2024889 RepID=A0A2A4T1X7_9DELT|nr:MAG: hypothetical protein COB67_08255 [SAR324 cluster bacterium]
MNEIKSFQKELLALANSLDKLLKVIHHSDPTAKSKQQLLYQKYQQRMLLLGKQLKQSFSWKEVCERLKELPKNSDFTASEESCDVIIRKLTKDFEKEFITKPVLQEFPSSPSPKPRKKKAQPLKKKKPFPATPHQQHYTQDSLMELIHFTKQQHQAKKDLLKLVEAIKRIGPDKIEQKINQSVKSTK